MKKILVLLIIFVFSSKTGIWGQNSSLPPSYDPRPLGLTTPVRGQGFSGPCALFAVIASAEHLIRKQTGRELLLSAEHLIFSLDFTYSHSLWTSAGVSPGVARTFMAGGYGLVYEQDFPYRGTRGLPLPANFQTVQRHLRMTGTAIVPGGLENHEAQKSAIMQYGGIVAHLAGTDSYNNTAGNRRPIISWYLSTNPGSSQGDHFVLLVGWDDNYSRSNFGTTPRGDGAWLIKDPNGPNVGDNGYRWLSYYDAPLLARANHSFFTGFKFLNPNEIIHSYGNGVTAQYGFGYYSHQTMFVANVFKISEQEAENYQINEVLFVGRDNYRYTIFLEQINTNGTLPNNTSLPSFQTINTWAQNRAYATIQTPVTTTANGQWRSVELDKPFIPQAGYYAVIIKAQNLTTERHGASFDQEINQGSYMVTINPGESFRMRQGIVWEDLTNLNTPRGNYAINTVLQRRN